MPPAIYPAASTGSKFLGPKMQPSPGVRERHRTVRRPDIFAFGAQRCLPLLLVARFDRRQISHEIKSPSGGNIRISNRSILIQILCQGCMSRASQNMNLGDLKAFVPEAESVTPAQQIIA